MGLSGTGLVELAALASVPTHLSPATSGEALDQRNLAVTANIYTHVLSDGSEVAYERLLPGPAPHATS
jgi:hypothetical protein